MSALLSVRDLHVHFPAVGEHQTPAAAATRAVDGISFDLRAGETLAIVGETGSGKTTIGRALLGLHPPASVQGSIRLQGEELVGLDETGWRAVRWQRIAMAVQSAGTAFDPVYRIAAQIAEPLRVHLHLSAREADARAMALARRLGLTSRHLRAYPHQLSGGEKQRAMLAMALSCEPEVLIADEPTSGQDVLSRAQLVALLQAICCEQGTSLLLISHDLAAVAQLTERVVVLYAGKLIETGDAAEILASPRHPYTWGLLNAYPTMTTARDLRAIRGSLPDPSNPPMGCRFHPRCTQAVARCRVEEPLLARSTGVASGGERLIACHLGGLQALLEATALRKAFRANGQIGRRPADDGVEAVRDVDLVVWEGEVVAVVGETGSGKTTLGRLLVGQLVPDAGQVRFEAQDLFGLSTAARKRCYRRIQFIAQDPFDAISPRLSVGKVVREPLEVQGIGTDDERQARAREALDAVSLPTDEGFLGRRAHTLSGGQLQRVAIARALVLDPKLLVADEPVSMLDASEQARVINLLKDIQSARGMGLLIISHDLALVRKIADRILVMQQGRIVEAGPAGRVISAPQHAYTRALLGAAPAFDW